jgi:hypothetical protein
LEQVQKIRTPMIRGPSSEFITERRFIGNNGDSKNDNRVVTVTLTQIFCWLHSKLLGSDNYSNAVLRLLL